jgi:hypothetical protein
MQLKFLPKLLLILTAIFIFSEANAQIVNKESFDNTTFLPSGWSAVGNTNLWSRRTTGTFPTCTPSSGVGMVRFASRGVAANTTQTISTPVIDYSIKGTSQAYISLWIYRDNGSVNADSLSVYINTTPSLTGATHFGSVARYTKLFLPDSVQANGWYKYTFNVPSSFSGNTNYILIKGVSQAGNNIHIDDVEWNSFPNVCAGVPNPGAGTASPSTICGSSGSSSITLSGYSTGVTGISFQWKVSSTLTGPWANIGVNTTTLNTGNITSTQYYKCFVTCANSGLVDSTSVIKVTVKQATLPTVTINPNAVNYCVGVPSKIFASGATTYVWTPTTGLSVSNSDTVFASPTVSTVYTVRGTDTAGCVGQANVNVTLRQNPNVFINALDTNLCVGDSVLLTAQTGGGGNTYLWLPEGNKTASIYAKPLQSNLYSVTVTNTFGCKGNAKRNLYVAQKPKAYFEVNVFARTYRFSDSSLNAQELLWDFGDGNYSTSRNPVYTYSEDGAKTITLIASNPPCLADTFTRTFNVSAINVFNNNKSLKLSPNPANRTVKIELDQASDFIQLIDLTGQVLLQENSVDKTSIVFDLSQLSKGVYFVRSSNGMQKLIIE